MTLKKIHNLQNKWPLLDTFDPSTQTWVVSDITSKAQLQRRLLSTHGQIEDLSVLRASELWRRMTWQHFPEWRVVSMDLIKTLILRELHGQKISWAQGPGAAHTVASQMTQFLPLLIHDPSGDLMAEWMPEHQDSLMRWGHWYQLAKRVWQTVEEEKLLPSQWLPGFLLSQSDATELRWERPLTVDLSAHLTLLEYKLFEKFEQVELLQPAPEWGSAFPEELAVYEPERSQKSLSMAALKVKGQFRMAHFTSPLGEVKDAVATVRNWLVAGLNPSQIALVAPDVEIYWPLLTDALAEEGIPVDKSLTLPLHGLPAVQNWLALLRLALGRLQAGDLELASFSRSKVELSYERFKQLFTNLYSVEQVTQVDWIKNQFRHELKSKEILVRDHFVARAASLWPDDDTNVIERIVKQLLEDAPPGVRFTSDQWFDWLEAWVGKIEMPVLESSGGIHCVNLASAEWLPFEKIYCLGVNEEALRGFSPYGLTRVEVDQLQRDLGVTVPSSEEGRLEFELRWLLDRPNIEGVISCPMTDPEGSPVTPSRIWLVQNEDPKVALKSLSLPQKTRWDELQQASLADIAEERGWSATHLANITSAINQDLGSDKLPQFGLGLRPGLSAHQLESYVDCPFLFAAGKLFHLSDLAAFDLDLDHMTKGRLTHKIFERLTGEPRKWNWSPAELNQLVDCALVELEVPDMGLWSQLRGRYVELAAKFLAFEKDWRTRFPRSQTVARELRFQAAWSVAKKQLVPQDEAVDGDYPLSGVIDRVDGDGQGEYVVLDYKSSTVNNSGIANWANNGSFQLALYVAAIESGLTNLPKGRVRGAFYFNAKDFSRDKGAQITGENLLIPATGRRNTAVTEEKRAEIFAAIFEKISGVVTNIALGEFGPAPKNVKTCPQCEWRWLCRAPHLN